jgi:hypothetical protein
MKTALIPIPGATILALIFLTAAAAQDTAGVGSLAGHAAGKNSVPAAGVRVCIAPSRCAVSDSEGGFRFADLRPGDYTAEVLAPGLPAMRSLPITVRAGLENQVRITLPDLQGPRQSVTVSDSVFVAPEEVKTSSVLVEGLEIFKSAVAQQDVSRYLQSLPGVAIADDSRNDLPVRGGSPLENLFIVDNVEVPNASGFVNLTSSGGITSILDAGLIRDVNFLTGGYPAPFIDRTSSVLQIATREGNRDEFRFRLSGDTLAGGGIAEGPLGTHRKGSWVASVKRSFFEVLENDKQATAGAVPAIYTINAKALYDVTPADRVWFVDFTGVESLHSGPVQDQKNDPEYDQYYVAYSGWRTAAGLNWQHIFGEHGVGLLGVSHAESYVNETVKDLGQYGLTGTADRIIADTPLLYSEKNREGESTIKYDFTGYATLPGRIQTGASFKIFHIDYNTSQPFGTDNPYSAIADVNPFSLRERLTTYQTGAYIQFTRNVTKRLNLTWGGRYDNYARLNSNRISPRAGLSYRVSDKLSLRSSYGIYFQQPPFLLIETFLPNRGLIPIRATHAVGGISYIVNPSVRMTLEVYRKDYRDYPVSLQYPTSSLANASDYFNLSDLFQPYTSAGRGRARGVEFLMEKKFRGRWFGQANIAYSHSNFSALDGVSRPGTYDFPLIVNGVAGYRVTKHWEASASFRYATGRPYTPFDIALSRQQDRGIYDLTRVNGLRTPAYFRPDLRFDRTFTVRGKPLLLWIGAVNVANRRNIAGVYWDQTANAPAMDRQIGIFPLIGLDWRL